MGRHALVALTTGRTKDSAIARVNEKLGARQRTEKELYRTTLGRDEGIKAAQELLS